MSIDPSSEAIAILSNAVIQVLKTTANFKPQLKQLKTTLDKINPRIEEIRKLNLQLDISPSDSEMFADEIEAAKKLVYKCLKIKWNLFKRFTHSLKLKDVDANLLRFFQMEVQAVQWRDNKQLLIEMNRVATRLSSMASNMNALVINSNSFVLASSRRRDGTSERDNLGWQVPARPMGIVAFEEPLEKLKAKVLAGIDDYIDMHDDNNDTSKVAKVVLVSAAGGCGKTTLVKMLCNDTDIKEKFGDNIFYVTVSEKPAFMVIVNDLFNPNFGQQIPFQSIEDAQHKLEIYFHEKVSGPILLVLDDVWSESFIKHFQFNIKVRYRVVVTSRMVFTKFDVFQFDPLSDEDAKRIFRQSVEPSPFIDEILVNQVVKCCKKHPLTLAVVGSSLDGKDASIWRHTIQLFSQGHLVLDLNEEVLVRLETSFEALEENFKQCYLDFGLFLEDQRIPAGALLNMWVHLYDHDDEGEDTLAKLYELSYRNLISIMDAGVRKDVSAAINYCEQQFVTQHDLLRQLAINLNSNLPIAERERLIISAQEDLLTTNVRGQERPASIEKVKGPMQARILSISTGESFSSRWCDLKAPEVEVLVLNLMSKTYALPQFLKEMQKLNIINVTNYGLYPTTLKNLDYLGCLSNLTRIRLERVTISSFSRSILALQNMRKVSFIMCKIGNVFEELSSVDLDVWPRLVEIEMDYCQDLVEFPGILCRSVYLKNLSITNCNDMCKISEEFGTLTSLETLSLRSCTKLEILPGSIISLQKLSVLDISDCLNLSELPEDMGNLGGLRIIYMKGCTGIHELPSSLQDLSYTKVVCNEEISSQWKEFPNVETIVVEEDRLETFMRLM